MSVAMSHRVDQYDFIKVFLIRPMRDVREMNFSISDGVHIVQMFFSGWGPGLGESAAFLLA